MTTSRVLTAGERALASSVFGSAIDLDAVRIVRGKWWPFQSRDLVMAPTGSVHFHPQSPLWSEDFSTAPLGLQGLFVHELTHVLQTQQRGRYYLPLMRHPFCRYRYTADIDRAFDRYGLEQQAEIVRHAFLQRRGPKRDDLPPLGLLEKILPFGTSRSADLA